MSFASLLRHTAVIRRRFPVTDGAGEPTYDEHGGPLTQVLALDSWRCRIEPKDARELAALSQAGAVVSTHTIFGFPADIEPGDQLVPGDGRVFEVDGIPDDAGGAGHHFEVNARLITSNEVEPS